MSGTCHSPLIVYCMEDGLFLGATEKKRNVKQNIYFQESPSDIVNVRVWYPPGRFHLVSGGYHNVPGRCLMMLERCHMLPGSFHVVLGRCHLVPGRCHMVSVRCDIVSGRCHRVRGR